MLHVQDPYSSEVTAALVELLLAALGMAEALSSESGSSSTLGAIVEVSSSSHPCETPYQRRKRERIVVKAEVLIGLNHYWNKACLLLLLRKTVMTQERVGKQVKRQTDCKRSRMLCCT